MISTVICDDERETAEQLCSLVKKYIPDCKIKICNSGIDLLMEKECCDILLLDVKMENLNGIETAKKLRENNSDTIIIFISALKEYVFSAFDVDAFHYLLKPVDEKKFKEVIERAAAETEKRTEKNCIFIKTRKKNFKLNTDDIIYLENEMRKIAVHTRNGTIEFYGAMSQLENQLGSDFFRCHRGYLVNLNFIEEYDSENIYLANGEKIYMSKEKYGEFVKSYMRFLRNEGTFYV